MPIVQTNDSQHLRNLIQINTLPVDIADKEQLRPGVVNDMNGIIGPEILKDRHDDGTICNRSQIDRHPVAVVAPHHGYLIVFLYSARLEEDVQFLDINGQLAVS